MSPGSAARSPATPLTAFAFVGASLLFALEPLAGRLLLFALGGAFHVWTSALMFFQGALLLAYLYAHLLPARAARLHLLLVALGLLWLPPSLGDAALDAGSSVAIVAALAARLGVPFVALASTAVMAQRWLARGGVAPYGLYAWSNAGSLAGLFGYALLLEPFFGLRTQRWAWTFGYVVFVALAWLAWRARPAALATRPRATPAGRPPRTGTRLYWGLLAAAPSALLLGVTNTLALDVGHAPLVWVVPLALYLGSFVWAFGRPVPRAVERLWPHVALVGLFFFSGGDAGSGWLEATIQLGVLGVVALAAHAELYRARPPARWLSQYYLVIALGGWVGGATVALLAPALFDGLWEYPLALLALAATVAVGRRRALARWLRGRPWGALAVSGALLLVVVYKVAEGGAAAGRTETLERARSFYGLYRVTRRARGDGAVRDLVSGDTRHGRQREGDATPLSYYHPAGPLGDAWRAAAPRRVGVVGLGVGAAAGHTAPGDTLRFFEIDPEVERLARRHFSYLARAEGEVDVVIGDARRALSRERGPRYDLLFVDAFAGDAIPAHLLTVEALAVALGRLADDGILLLHLSNRYYALRPVSAANARALGLAGVHLSRLRDLAPDEDPSEYVALARRAATLAPLRRRGWRPLDAGLPPARAWTDDRLHTLSALRR